MIVYIITTVYQGVYDGIEIATFDKDKAEDRYRQLVRDAMGFHGRDNPWEDVENAYDAAIENCLKIEEYYLGSATVT